MYLLIILVLVFVGLVIFHGGFRTWIGAQLNSVWTIAQLIAPDLGRFLRVTLTAYGVIILITSVLVYILMLIALFVGSPVLTAICAISAICLGILIWLPVGLIMRLFGVNEAVLPPSVRAMVSYAAFFAFVAFAFPEIMTFKLLLGIALVGFISMGLSTKFDFLGKIAWPVVLLICGIIGWNYFFPENFRATTRHLNSLSNATNAFQDRNSIKNNTWASTTYGKLRKNVTEVYKANFNYDTIASLDYVPVKLEEGLIVKLVSQKHEVQNFDGAGFIEIQLARNNGSFVDGNKYWIEADLVDNIGTRKEVEGETADNSANSPIHSSESIMLHKGEHWSTNHLFRTNEMFKLEVKYAPVKQIQSDGSSQLLAVGNYNFPVLNDGSPHFVGVNKLAKITIRY